MSLDLYLMDEAATINSATQFAPYISPGWVIYLAGDLGTGKTTWTRGLLNALGHSGKVKSPTYTLVEPYQLSERQLFHFDLYRLNQPDELEDMGIRDYFSGQAICILEWPEKGAGYIPTPDWTLQFQHQSPGRQLSVQAHTLKGEKALESLQRTMS